MMFNVEQFTLNTQFQDLGPTTTIRQLLPLLEDKQSAVIRTEALGNHQAILILPEERTFLLETFAERLDECASAMLTTSPFLSQVIRLEPEPSPEAALLAVQAQPSHRPLLISDSLGSVAGYVHPADVLAFAIAEQQRWRAYFATLAETVTDAVTVVDRKGEVICWNSVAEDIYDLVSEDILGRRIGEHFEADTLMVLRILDEGRLIRNTYHRPREGTHVLINASPIRSPQGEIIGGIAAEQDITQLVKLNEQLTSAHTFSHQHKSADSGLFSFMKGKGPAIGKVMQWAKKVAASDTPVLLVGEGGSGKEQLAQIIHEFSSRADKTFLSANCGTVPAGLLETELFGFQGGAFSGSESGQPGKLELAKDGTLFVNEINRLTLELQAKLYHYLSQQTIVRIGGSRPIPVRTRIIAASTEDLAACVENGSFRSDLYYALNVVSIVLPPLRERREDIPAMLQMYLKQFSLQYQKPLPALSPEVMLAFANYDWPGNILELRNVVERCVILCEDDLITMELLPQTLQERQPSFESGASRTADELQAAVKPLKSSHDPSEDQRLIQDALARTAGNKSAAAKLLGVSRGTLYNKMKELELQ